MTTMLTKDGARRLAYKVPWLYHVVHRSEEVTRETITSDGIAPGPSRHNWHPLFRPRPGHVYLATRSYLSTRSFNLWREGDDLYAIRTSSLLAERVNPDEDHFIGSDIGMCSQFHLPPPACMDLWKMFGSSVVPSYGDWADQVELGSDPAHTVHSASRGSLAYSGVVPPKALRWWDGTRWRDPLEAMRMAARGACI